MAVVMPPRRPYSDQIVPAELWPTVVAAADDAADYYAQAGKDCATKANNSRTTAGQLAALTEGAFSEAMVAAHQRIAVAHDDHATIVKHLKNAADEIADIAGALAGRLDLIDDQAHQAISASPPEAREGIIAAAHAAAITAHADAAAKV
jgi:hypothetical protein